ncbi:MAG: LacI family DNA-binding transcriptional regulator, partial [Pseudomonadota bacterium]
APMRRVTLQDVSERAGVDKSTVSRALRGDETLRIKPETRHRIEGAVAELGYQPNPAARNLRTARSHVLGAVIPALENPIYAQMLKGAEQAARDRGYTLLIANIEADHSDAAVFERLHTQHGVDGLLVCTLRNQSVMIPALKSAGSPYVLVNRQADGVENWVVGDDYGAARLATQHLIDNGHQRIAYLSGDPERYNSRMRVQGYRDALEAAGLAVDDRLMSVAGYSFERGGTAMRDLLAATGRGEFSAIVAVTMLVGCGAMSVLHEEGFRLPRDISVISIHDGAPAEMVYPPMTTVRVPLFEMGAAGADNLIDIIEGKKRRVQVTFGEVALVERKSVARR